MSVDMTKWQEIAKKNVHNRTAAQGRLAGKVTIVTGAAQGFGKGIAEELYKEGATIIIADMNQTLAEQVAAEMGERACAIPVNVSNEESVANLVAQTVEKFGGLDIMVANAGVVRSGPIATFEQKDFEFVTAINYTGLFLCAKYAAIIMQAQKEADPDASYDIISISSKSGLEGSNKTLLTLVPSLAVSAWFSPGLWSWLLWALRSTLSAPATTWTVPCGLTLSAVCLFSTWKPVRFPVPRPLRMCAASTSPRFP